VLLGNPDLDPEEITTYDAQLFYHDEKRRFSLTWFRSEMEDLIIRTPLGGGQFTYANRGDMDFWGLEFEGNCYITPNFYTALSALYQANREDSGSTSSLVPDWMWKLGLGYEEDRISSGVFYSYFTNPPSTLSALNANPEPDDVHWVTANLNLDITDWFSFKGSNAQLTFGMDNVLNDKVIYPEFNRRRINSLPGAPGRTYFMGLRIQF